MNKEKAFRITEGKGFHMSFDNGLTVSVQWGYGNYSDNRNIEINHNNLESSCAEVLVYYSEGEQENCTEMFGMKDCDGWVSAERVAKLIYDVSIWRKTK